MSEATSARPVRVYPSDLRDAEWALIAPHLPPEVGGGRHRSVDLRRVVNAVLYRLRSGCSWAMLPRDFPPRTTVYEYFAAWRKAGVWERMNELFRRQVRQAVGKNAEPTAAILDSQSVKTTETPGDRGYDAGKKVNGRKRHVLVDTLGLLLMVTVTAANVQDRDGAKPVLASGKKACPQLQKVWADGGYAGQLVAWTTTHAQMELEIVKRSDAAQGFVLLPRRWVVERTFGWLGRYRVFSKDYEKYPQTSEQEIYLAMSHLMVRRLTKTEQPKLPCLG
jgi:putative transposase